jgi:hypothetical protein
MPDNTMVWLVCGGIAVANQGYAEISCLGWVCGIAANPTQTISLVVVRRPAQTCVCQQYLAKSRASLWKWKHISVFGGIAAKH